MSTFTVCDECKYITDFGHARTCSSFKEPPERKLLADRAFIIRGMMTEVARDKLMHMLVHMDKEGKEVHRIVVEVIDPGASLARSAELMNEMFPDDTPSARLPAELVMAMGEFCDYVIKVLDLSSTRPWIAWGPHVASLAERIKELRGPNYRWPEI